MLLNWFSMYVLAYKIYDWLDEQKKLKFPIYIYIVMGILSFIPIINIIAFIVYVVILVIFRMNDEITIKGPNYFDWLNKKF
jgi:hypothetical protein